MRLHFSRLFVLFEENTIRVGGQLWVWFYLAAHPYEEVRPSQNENEVNRWLWNEL